jgi:hypothetical protein
MADKIRELAHEAGIDDEQCDAFEASMDSVEDVLKGRRQPPGGPNCLFPHCACNSPWEKCEAVE